MKALAIVDEEMVRSVPEPEFTITWHPVSHGKVIDSLELAVKESGMGIVDRHYSLHKEGMNMFGTWHLDHRVNGSSWMIGVRNSMCKSFAIGICAGTHVIVCSNLMFSGDFIEFRKHTSGVDLDELRDLSVRAIGGVTGKLQELEYWHTGLKEYPINENEFKVLTFNALEAGVIPTTKFEKFVNCHAEETELSDPSLFTFHGGVTRLIKNNSLFNIADYSRKLIRFCDDYKERNLAVEVEEPSKLKKLINFWR